MDLLMTAVLGTDIHRLLCAGCDERDLRRGETLFGQGEQARMLYLIEQGSFKLVRLSEDGRETVLRLAGRGEVLGQEVLFQDTSYAISAIALENARVCGSDRRKLEEVIKLDPDLAARVIASLGARLREAWSRQSELAGQTAREKILNLLKRLAAEHGEREPGGTKIRMRLTQEELAGMIGSSRVMVATVLRELQARGCVTRRGRHLVVTDKRSAR